MQDLLHCTLLAPPNGDDVGLDLSFLGERDDGAGDVSSRDEDAEDDRLAAGAGLQRLQHADLSRLAPRQRLVAKMGLASRVGGTGAVARRLSAANRRCLASYATH
eukprot:2738723-Rhodomonas_salina.6